MLSFCGPSKIDPLLPKVSAAYEMLNTAGKKLHLYLSDMPIGRDMFKMAAFAHKNSNTTVTYLNPEKDSVNPEKYKHTREAIVLFFDITYEKLYANGVEITETLTPQASFTSVVGSALASIKEEPEAEAEADLKPQL